MILVKSRLGLDDFILKMLSIPSEALGLEQLQEWVATLQLSDDFFDRHLRFGDRTYTRTLVCRTPRFDLLILCWRPGQSSTIHDHADSLNATRVHRGCLTSREFALDSPASHLTLQRETCHERGELVTVERHAIHQLANTSNENLVTLHVYARPLRTIQVYCPDSGRCVPLDVQYDNAA
jgi:cysteine dioxygenase